MRVLALEASFELMQFPEIGADPVRVGQRNLAIDVNLTSLPVVYFAVRVFAAYLDLIRRKPQQRAVVTWAATTAL